MLGRYTDLIEGTHRRAAQCVVDCFDHARSPVVHHPGRPQRMVGGKKKKEWTLYQIEDGKGAFLPKTTH